MKDKLYRELNRSKPDKSVLDAAKEEMRTEKRPKRAYLKPVLGACCSIVLIAVVIVALTNPAFGIGGCTSSDKNSYNETTDKNNSSIPGTSEDGTEVFVQAPFYETADGVFEDGSVTVRVLPPLSEYTYDGEITIGEYSVRARYRATADGYEVYTENFMLEIEGDRIGMERLEQILGLVTIL